MPSFPFRDQFRVRNSEVDPQAIVEYWRAMALWPGDPDWPEGHVGTATVRYII